jgi:uncharacterized protein
MPKDYLPHKIDPFKLATHETVMHGYLKIKDMARLCTSLDSDEGDVEVKMVFGMDEQGTCIIKSVVRTRLMFRCQRCMESLSYEIMLDSVLGVVKKESDVKNLPEGYIPVVVEAGVLMIQDMIEDDLIVNLPVVPMHSPENCKVKLPYELGSEEPFEANNPFNVISTLRSKEKKKGN